MIISTFAGFYVINVKISIISILPDHEVCMKGGRETPLYIGSRSLKFDKRNGKAVY